MLCGASKNLQQFSIYFRCIQELRDFIYPSRKKTVKEKLKENKLFVGDPYLFAVWLISFNEMTITNANRARRRETHTGRKNYAIAKCSFFLFLFSFPFHFFQRRRKEAKATIDYKWMQCGMRFFTCQAEEWGVSRDWNMIDFSRLALPFFSNWFFFHR